MKKKEPKFIYKNSKCVRVVDGDTIELLIMLTFNLKIKKKIRLARIDAPEMKELDGDKIKQYVKALVLNRRVDVYVTAKDGWGRWIAEIEYGDGINLSDHLLEEGLVEVYT